MAQEMAMVFILGMMVLYIKETGKIIWGKDKERSNGTIMIDILEIGVKIREMVKGSRFMLIRINMMENGKMIWDMDLVYFIGIMETSMKDNGKKIKLLDKEIWFTIKNRIVKNWRKTV